MFILGHNPFISAMRFTDMKLLACVYKHSPILFLNEGFAMLCITLFQTLVYALLIKGKAGHV
jgi:hypothetical protein